MTQPLPTSDTAQRHSYKPQMRGGGTAGNASPFQDPLPTLLPCARHFSVYKELSYQFLHVFLTTVLMES